MNRNKKKDEPQSFADKELQMQRSLLLLLKPQHHSGTRGSSSPKYSAWVQASLRKHSSVLCIDLQHWGGECRNSDTSAFFFCQKALGNCNCSCANSLEQRKLCTCFLIQPICSTSAKLCLKCVQKIKIVPQDYWCPNPSFASKAKVALQADCAVISKTQHM